MGFHKWMAACGVKAEGVHVHVKSQMSGQQIADKHVGHVFVDALFHCCGIAEYDFGLMAGQGDVALLVEQKAHRGIGGVGKLKAFASGCKHVAAGGQSVLLPAGGCGQRARAIHDI